MMSVRNDQGKTFEIASSIIANRRQVHYSATAGSQSSFEIIFPSVRVSEWVWVCVAIAFPSLPGPQGRAASCTLSEEPCHLASLGTHKLETSLRSSRTKETREAKLTGKHLLWQSRPKDIRRTEGVLQEMAGLIQCTRIPGGGCTGVTMSIYTEIFCIPFFKDPLDDSLEEILLILLYII